MTNRIYSRYLLDLIKYPILTDKTSKHLEDNVYCFAVERKANKKEIKQAIEYIFEVEIKKINTLNTPKKKKKVGKYSGYITQYKKAIIQLKESYTLNLFKEN